MPLTDWKDKKYDEVFESCLRSLRRQRQNDPSFTPEAVRGLLSHLYVQEGNDWAGRGEVQDVQIDASIAAYERFLSEWETEQKSDS